MRNGLWLGFAVVVSGTPVIGQTVAAHGSSNETRSAREALARPVTITLHQVSLSRALDSLAHVARVLVQYQESDVRAYPAPVSINVVKTPLGVVFERVLSGTQLRVVPAADGDLAIVATDVAAADSVPAKGTISGRVTDSATGRGLTGVTIKVAGTKLATTTRDSTGRFVLHDVPTGSQLLTIRVFGYRPGERTVDVTTEQQAAIRIMLTSTPNMLSGVVTTATGTRRKIEVGNDITTLNADSLMKVAPITSVTDMLENRVPGLSVLRSSGSPGDPARIRIAGAQSISQNNDPIVYVDGVRVYSRQSDSRNSSLAPAKIGGNNYGGSKGAAHNYATPSPIDQIDPNSIQTIEVFKGPSASSLYGPDAASGVIVITTKHGQAGATQWDANLTAGLSYEPRQWPVNYYRFGNGTTSEIGSPFCAWYDVGCTVDSIVPFQALNDPQYNLYADHGNTQSGTLTVYGGAPALTWSLTGGASSNIGDMQMPGIEQQRFLKQYGYAMPHWMVRPQKFTKTDGSGKITISPAQNIAVTLSSALHSEVQEKSSLETGISQLEGEYLNPLLLGAAGLLTGEYERHTESFISATNGINAGWSPKPWLPLTFTGGLSTGLRIDKTYVPYGIYTKSPHIGVLYDSTGWFGYGHGTTLDKNISLGTQIPIGSMSLGLGMGYHDGSTDDFQASTDELAPGVTEPSTFLLSQNAPIDLKDQFTHSSSNLSTYDWFIEPRLNLNSKFFASPGFMLAGGNGSGANRSGFNGGGLTSLSALAAFPKMDLSYLLVDRPDNPLWGVISQFRAMLALGVGATSPTPDQKLRQFNAASATVVNGTTVSTGYDFNGNVVPVTILSTIGNRTLQPERSRDFSPGFDLALWNNRLTTNFSHSSQDRHNALLQVLVATSAIGGQYSQWVNIGEIRSSTTLLTVTANVLENRNVGWIVVLGYTSTNDVLVHLNPGQSTYTSTGGRLVAGYPLASVWDFPIKSYADANHDGVIEKDEIRYGDSLVYLGQQGAPQTLNMSSHLSLFHGTFSVNAEVGYTGGLTQVNQAALTSDAIAQFGNAPGTTLVQQADIVAAQSGQSAIGVTQTVSTLRFQSLSFNYSVPTAISRRLRLPRATLALMGSNLGLHTNYRGMDPNVNAYSTVGAFGDRTVDAGEVPIPKTWTLSVQLGSR